ncbi:MAG: Hsp20/alpha crystallin family protein [Candidatus Bathyarchaeota archaeon]|nr:Hsp20/alpha crystallin family protein [Candidatus Bathyarchaeota archaeon]
MATVRRRSIFDIIHDYIEELEEITDEIIERYMESPSWDVKAQSLEPLFNVFVSSDKVTVTVDLPKADPESIKISILSDNLIEITAKMKMKIHFEDFGVTHRRGEFTQFCCRIPLPAPVETSGAKARFLRGVLEITFPRKRGYEIKIE